MKRAALIFFFAIMTTACDGLTGSATAWKMLSATEESLKPGDPPAKIESFFKTQGWRFGYDDVLGYWDAIGPDSHNDWRHVVLRVHVDAEGRFVRAETQVAHYGL